MNASNNESILDELKKYTCEGYVRSGDHVPVKGKGCRYTDADGKEYLDLTSGIFTNTLGHCPEEVTRAAVIQNESLSNIHGRHCIAELEFYRRLFPMLPADDYKAIPYNDGSYAIDRGLSDIINYFGKKRIVIAAYNGGFHGKTQAAKLLINRTEKAALYENVQLDFPDCGKCVLREKEGSCGMKCIEHTRRQLEEKNVSALVFEPVQGARIIIPPDGYWRGVQDICRERGIIMFADEVLTGGGRCGSYLACCRFGIVPDMLALTKGLANGRPLSVLLEREYLTKNEYAVRFMERSSTFAAHPDALAAAAELLVRIEKQDIIGNVRRLEKILKDGLDSIKNEFSCVADCRCIGLMAAVEFRGADICGTVFSECRRNGLELIYSGDCLRIAPPLNITREELETGIELLRRSMSAAAAHG